MFAIDRPGLGLLETPKYGATIGELLSMRTGAGGIGQGGRQDQGGG